MSGFEICIGVVLLLTAVVICYSVVSQDHDQHRGGVSGQGMAVRKKRVMTEKDGLNLITKISAVVGTIALIVYFIVY